MNTVYEYYTRRVAFEGTTEECWNWIMSQAFTFRDGRKFFRTWQEDGDQIYDVGNIYIFNR